METLIAAVSLGLVAGLSPGPLMAVVLSASVERGFRSGALTALAPILTDAPVVLLSLFVLGRVPPGFLSAVTVAGGVFVSWIGVRTIVDSRRPQLSPRPPAGAGRDLWRGAMVNLLSPHPWLFWFTVGTPLMLERWRVAPWESVAFPAVFVGLLVGCKMGVAWAGARGRRLVGSVGYRRLLVALGMVLVAFGLWLAGRGALALRG